MKNVFIIGLIVVSMVYMGYILLNKYNKIVEQEENKKSLHQNNNIEY